MIKAIRNGCKQAMLSSYVKDDSGRWAKNTYHVKVMIEASAVYVVVRRNSEHLNIFPFIYINFLEELCSILCNLYLIMIHLSNNLNTFTFLKGLCQLESMRSEVMQITFNCQNSIVFNA